jgi:hypothetical protein
MSDLKLTPSLLSMLERIEKHSGTLLMLAVTASGGQDGKLNKLRGAGYVVKCEHPTVTRQGWPAEALAITEAGRAALAKHRTEVAEKKERHGSDDQRVIFRRDGDRYVAFLGDDRIGFVRRADNGTWNHVETTMAHSGYAKTRGRAVSYCAAATSAWFERARSDGQSGTTSEGHPEERHHDRDPQEHHSP